MASLGTFRLRDEFIQWHHSESRPSFGLHSSASAPAPPEVTLQSYGYYRFGIDPQTKTLSD